jgi:hypothetical protein
MTETLKIFDHNTLSKIRARILEDGFEKHLIGSSEEIAENVGGRLIDSDIEFDDGMILEPPAVGENNFDDVDIINTEVVYRALPGLTAFEASRDELWATLTLGHYTQYVRRRWRAASQQDIDLRRNYRLHYLSSGIRNRWRDNAIGRLWWLHHYSRMMLPDDPYRALKVLFFRDKNLGETLLTKPSIATVPSVARAVIEISYERFIEPGSASFSRDGFRSVIRDIDVASGRSLLSLMPPEKVRTLVDEIFRDSFTG